MAEKAKEAAAARTHEVGIDSSWFFFEFLTFEDTAKVETLVATCINLG
jgi:hypothetical protein